MMLFPSWAPPWKSPPIPHAAGSVSVRDISKGTVLDPLLPCLSAPAHCNMILTASEWLAPLPDHSTEHQGHNGAGSRCSWSLCLIHGPRDTAKERSSPSSRLAHLLTLGFGASQPTEGWGSAQRDRFSGEQIPPVGWVLDAKPAAETQAQSGAFPRALLGFTGS